MTLPPTDQAHRYVPASGPLYEFPFECANPRCYKRACERHHVWRRKAHGVTGGSGWILDTETGDVLPNLLGLCHDCHGQITGGVGGHKARILYVDDPDRCLHWLVKCDGIEKVGRDTGWESVGEIRWPTPLRYEALA